jgi:hypothetical protein
MIIRATTTPSRKSVSDFDEISITTSNSKRQLAEMLQDASEEEASAAVDFLKKKKSRKST